ncbi:MAG: alanine racemase [Myxococcota bacterium]
MVSVGEESGRPTWAEIDLGALARNLRAVRGLAQGRRVIAVVKANAYGHGAVAVSSALEREGADMLAVATVEEARELRLGGIRLPLLLLEGLHDPGDADVLLPLNLVPLIGRIESLAPLEGAARRAGRPLPVHLKIDTGMGRLGLLPDELGGVFEVLRGSVLELEGIATHLSEADDGDSTATDSQRRRFEDAVQSARASGFEPAWIHADPSAGLVHGPTRVSTAVRPGILLYGPDPTLEGGHGLEGVMTLVTRVIRAKDLPPGSRIGYGGTYVTSVASRILTVPVGYADGLPRSAGGRVELGLGDRLVPLVGRVSMDLATLDAGPGSNAEVGEEVLIFGRRGGLELRVEKIAAATDTISYEILVRVGARVPRV